MRRLVPTNPTRKPLSNGLCSQAKCRAAVARCTARALCCNACARFRLRFCAKFRRSSREIVSFRSVISIVDCSFFNLLLLPAVIADIDENKKLNYHYYLALKKACFKPAAFYKGIILPVVEVRIAAAMLHAAAFTP